MSTLQPITVANKIVQLKNNSLTIMELLKLQYIAHGYSLAILDKPLFDATIEAWPYGPVIRDIYSQFRAQGIHITATIPSNYPDKFSDEQNAVINGVIESYGNKNGWELSTITHELDSPWTKTVSEYGFFYEIPDSLTKAYYKGLANKNGS